MKRLVIAALAVATVCVVAGSALAAKPSVIFDSTSPNGPKTNAPSYGAEAYGFKTIGDQINFKAGTARNLSNVTVTLSSWACQQGTWNGANCVTASGAKFSQEMTLKIWNADHTTQLAASTKTFDVSYRPSASTKCTGGDAGKWMNPAKECKNGITQDVTFDFSNVTLPETVVYEVSYNTNHYGPAPTNVAGPYDSLNLAIADAPSVGTTTDGIWTDGAYNQGFDGNWAFDNHVTPAVQFKTGN